MAISDNTIVIHDSNPRFVGLLLIALIVVSIGYFVITTIHDMNREKRLDAIKKDIERNNSVIGILLILAMTGLAPTYSSQGRYEEYTPWFPIVLTMCFVGIGITCIISSVSNRRKKYEEYDDEVISREKREKKSKITALYDMIPIWLQEVLRIGIPLIGIIVIMNFVVLGTSVMSGSMEPKLKVGSSVFYNKLAYKKKAPERGDIIAFWSGEEGKLMSKRVIGLPGDTIEFHNGYVYINGIMADEREYISEDIETNSNKVFNVPAECVFVLGDNRENSYDSRYWKLPYVPYKDIKGKYMGQFGFSLRYKLLEMSGKLDPLTGEIIENGEYESVVQTVSEPYAVILSKEGFGEIVSVSTADENLPYRAYGSDINSPLSVDKIGLFTMKKSEGDGISLNFVWVENVHEIENINMQSPEGCHWECAVMTIVDSSSDESSYVDVRVFGSDGNKLKYKGISCPYRTFELDKGTKEGIMTLGYSIYYAVPDGCKEYILRIGNGDGVNGFASSYYYIKRSNG